MKCSPFVLPQYAPQKNFMLIVASLHNTLHLYFPSNANHILYCTPYYTGLVDRNSYLLLSQSWGTVFPKVSTTKHVGQYICNLPPAATHILSDRFLDSKPYKYASTSARSQILEELLTSCSFTDHQSITIFACVFTLNCRIHPTASDHIKTAAGVPD